MLEETARELFPNIALKFEYCFSGTHVATFAGMPVIDNHPNYQNCCYAVSGGENSVLISATAANVLTKLCNGTVAGRSSLFALRR